MYKFDHLIAKEALKAFYSSQNLDQTANANLITYYPLGFVKIPFVNLSARKAFLHLHDLNHILLNVDTTVRGEAQLAALELGSGFPAQCRIGYLYSPFALLPGLVLCPIRVFKSYFRGRKIKNACHVKMQKDQLLNCTVLEIKTYLGLVSEGEH